MAEQYTPYQKDSREKHLQQMEGWRSQPYVLNDNSGVTVAFGIDLSQPPYNTKKGLTENGFTNSQAEAIMRTGALGKTVKQLKKENFDFDTLKKVNIPDNIETKKAIAKPIFEKVDKVLAPYKDNVSPEVYNSLSTIVHFAGGKGAEGGVGSKDPFERKNASINNIFVKLDQAISDNPNTVLQNSIILDSMQESMEALSIDSPMNSTTLLREMKYIDPSVVKNRNLDIYEKKEGESFSALSRRGRLRKKEAISNSTIDPSSLKTQKEIKRELGQSIDEGISDMGDAQLSPDFIRGVQDGSIPLYDKDAKNAIMALDADDPGSTLSAKDFSAMKDVLGRSQTGMLAPFDEKTIEVGPDPTQQEVGVPETEVATDETVEQDKAITIPKSEVTELETPEAKIIKQKSLIPPGPHLKKGFGDTGVGKFLKGLDYSRLAQAGLGLIAGAQGRKHLKDALEDLPIEEGHKLDGAWKDYMSRMNEMSKSGLSAEEKYAAKSELSNAYNLGVKNVMRAAGGSRAAFLANAGVLNANRVEGLLKLTALDAATHRANLKNYGTAVQYQQQHDQQVKKVDRTMAYNEVKRKADIHAGIGDALIGTALESINNAISKRSNPVAGAFDNLTAQTIYGNEISNESAKIKAQNTALGI